MPSSAERGAYATSRNVPDWNRYNPLGYKMTPFPENFRCSLCGTNADVAFPIQAKCCGTCAEKLKDYKDGFYRYSGWRLSLNGHFCEICGKVDIVYHIVNTRICHKCTIKLGKKQHEYQEWRKHVRRVI